MKTNEYLAAARHCAMQMMQNAAYIAQELPGIDVPDDIKLQIQELCDNWVETKHDVFSEIHDLDSAEEETGVYKTLSLIHGLLAAAVEPIDGCVAKIQEAAAAGRVEFIIFMLVAESATNVLNSMPAPPEPEARVFEPSLVAAESPSPTVYREIPAPDLLPQVLELAHSLIAESVDTPERLAQRVEDFEPGGTIRAHSEFLWRTVNTYLMAEQKHIDWPAIYDRIDNQEEKDTNRCEGPEGPLTDIRPSMTSTVPLKPSTGEPANGGPSILTPSQKERLLARAREILKERASKPQ